MDDRQASIPPLRLDDAPPWVMISSEVCRGGRVIYTISNRCTRVALTAGVDLTEYALQQQMVGWFDEEGLVSDSPPVVRTR